MNNYISKDGHLKEEYISLYIDAMLLDKVMDLPGNIVEHVEDCKVCKLKIIEGYDILKETGELKIQEHPYFGNKKNENKVLRGDNFHLLYKIAASILIIASLGIITYHALKFEKPPVIVSENTEQLNQKDKKQGIKIAIVDSLEKTERIEKEIKEENIKEPETKELIAKNDLSGEEYQVSAILVSMLGTNTRASFFEVEYPKDSTIIGNGKGIDFVWNSDIDEEIKLKIFNYKEELIFESKMLRSNGYNLTETLSPGAYIWKIEGIDELYHLGLFFIKK